MRLVVADTGPLQYLLLIDQITLLPKLFEAVIIPSVVQQEMLHEGAPLAVRTWAAAPPNWLAVSDTEEEAITLATLDAGERAAIHLAMSIKAELILMDDRRGVHAAEIRGLRAVGTLGILDLAARRGLVDLDAAFSCLQETNFRYPPNLLQAILTAWKNDRGT